MRTDESITVGVFGRLFGRKLMMPITPAKMAMTSMMGPKYRKLKERRQLQVFNRLADCVTISLRQLIDDEISPLSFSFLGCLSSSGCARGIKKMEKRQVGGINRPEV